MMFSEKFVVSLKVDGKFLRDSEGEVKIPFGSEYEIYLKNLNSKDVVVTVQIDNQDVLNGHKIIVKAGQSSILEGFLQGTTATKKFRFIELTKDVEDFRGYKPEDGIIRITIQYEKDKPEYKLTYNQIQPHYKYYHYDYNDTIYKNIDVYCGSISKGFNSSGISCTSYNVSSQSGLPTMDSCTSDVGITVGGENISQKFNYGTIGELEENIQVIVLRLSGYKGEEKIETLITTKDKIKCSTCGLENSSNNKFCGRCGTNLW